MRAVGLIEYPQQDFPFWVFQAIAGAAIAAVSLRHLRRDPSIAVLLATYSATLLAFAEDGAPTRVGCERLDVTHVRRLRRRASLCQHRGVRLDADDLVCALGPRACREPGARAEVDDEPRARRL